MGGFDRSECPSEGNWRSYCDLHLKPSCVHGLMEFNNCFSSNLVREQGTTLMGSLDRVTE